MGFFEAASEVFEAVLCMIYVEDTSVFTLRQSPARQPHAFEEASLCTFEVASFIFEAASEAALVVFEAVSEVFEAAL